ncbi:hypothetical protein QCN27_03770 [Cereibacter sp. SYSU M97828]|nr:hypothetical protein [Cereibacter flavus]
MDEQRMILSCCKTGRWIRVASIDEAKHQARDLGWVDYEVTHG